MFCLGCGQLQYKQAEYDLTSNTYKALRQPYGEGLAEWVLRMFQPQLPQPPADDYLAPDFAGGASTPLSEDGVDSDDGSVGDVQPFCLAVAKQHFLQLAKQTIDLPWGWFSDGISALLEHRSTVAAGMLTMSSQPDVRVHIKFDLTWELEVLGKALHPSILQELGIPSPLTSVEDVNMLLALPDEYGLCSGIHDMEGLAEAVKQRSNGTVFKHDRVTVSAQLEVGSFCDLFW